MGHKVSRVWNLDEIREAVPSTASLHAENRSASTMILSCVACGYTERRYGSLTYIQDRTTRSIYGNVTGAVWWVDGVIIHACGTLEYLDEAPEMAENEIRRIQSSLREIASRW